MSWFEVTNCSFKELGGMVSVECCLVAHLARLMMGSGKCRTSRGVEGQLAYNDEPWHVEVLPGVC